MMVSADVMQAYARGCRLRAKPGNLVQFTAP
jgi:hypothetical protein